MRVDGYRHGRDIGEYGTFYSLTPMNIVGERYVTKVFNNPLIVSYRDASINEGLPCEYLYHKWFGNTSAYDIAPIIRVSDGEIMDYFVVRQALERGYDGIIFEDIEFIDLSTFKQRQKFEELYTVAKRINKLSCEVFCMNRGDFVPDLGSTYKTTKVIPPHELVEVCEVEVRVDWDDYNGVEVLSPIPPPQPGYLYHATFAMYAGSIMDEGIIPNRNTNWGDWSERGYSYFGSSPAECVIWMADLMEEQVEDTGDIEIFDNIVVFGIRVF